MGHGADPHPDPDQRRFQGLKIYAQGFVVDPQGAWSGLALTEDPSMVLQ